MGKIMKPGKVVIVLAGRYAGRKAVILKNHDDGNSDKSYGHAVVAGIDRYPKPIYRRHNKEERKKRCRVKPFIKCINYSHLMPTRYLVDVQFDKKVTARDVIKDKAKRTRARAEIKAKFQERYKTGKNKWFFCKLRF
ncbi:60S ribosomal protein L27, partial [Fragariocoptes setiger]